MEPGNRPAVQNGPEGTGSEDVRLHVVDLIRLHDDGAQLVGRSIDPVLVDVGHDQLRPLFGQIAGQIVADVAYPLDRDRLLAQVIVTVFPQGTCLHPAVGPERGDGRRIAGASHDPHDVLGLRVHVVHVRDRGAHVLRRDVSPTQTFDHAAVGPHDHLAIVCLVVADDHGLPATEVEPGDRRLEGHAAGEPEDVDESVEVGRVLPEPGAAQSRPERRVVDGHDPLVAAGGLVAEHDLLVAVLGEEVE